MPAIIALEFTPLEFETQQRNDQINKDYYQNLLRWSLKLRLWLNSIQDVSLEFTPLELETILWSIKDICINSLEFTPLEFETQSGHLKNQYRLKLEFTPLEFETLESR